MGQETRTHCHCGEPTSSGGWLCDTHDGMATDALRNIAGVFARVMGKGTDRKG